MHADDPVRFHRSRASPGAWCRSKCLRTDTQGEMLHLRGGYSTLRYAAEHSAPVFRETLKAAPRIRNVYWCGLPRDMRQPEFWKARPVAVNSPQNLLTGPILGCPHDDKAAPR